MQKAYKVLSLREKISNRKAKEMLDLGLVFSNGKKIQASELIPSTSPLKILKVESPEIIFEDENLLAINKPAFFDSYHLERIYKPWILLNRIDKHTSGVILLTKEDSDFRKDAINEFKNEMVYKEYLALAQGIIAEDFTIDKPIVTTKGNYAMSKIDYKLGKKALTIISPLKIINRNTLLKVIIKTGKTHQIRVHLNAINHPILGDSLYGRIPYRRLMLHSYKIKLFDYEFCAKEGNFWKYLQD